MMPLEVTMPPGALAVRLEVGIPVGFPVADEGRIVLWARRARLTCAWVVGSADAGIKMGSGAATSCGLSDMRGSSKFRSKLESEERRPRRRWDLPSKVTRAFSEVQDMFCEEKRDSMVWVLRGMLKLV